MQARAERRNLWLLSFAILCNQSAYITLENVQSTLNKSRGMTALAVLYACYFTAAIFLPSYAITRFGCKRCIVVCMSSYTLYIAANFYPVSYTLVPAAAIMGSGGGVMWAALFSYVITLSESHALRREKDVEATTKNFFGILFSFVNFSSLFGSTIMSVLFSVAPSGVTESPAKNDSVAGTEENYLSDRNSSGCGLYYTGDSGPDSASNLSKVTLYLLFSAFLALNVVGTLLCACLDDFENKKRNESKHNTLTEKQDVSLALKSENSTQSLAGSFADTSPSNNNPEKVAAKSSPLRKIKGTLSLISTDAVAVLTAPLVVHMGALQAFIRGTFNGSWVSCEYGVRFVSFSMIFLYASMALTSLMSARILKKVDHRALYTSAVVAELACLVTLFISPSKGSNWYFFLISSALGFSHSMFKTQTPSTYALFFPGRQSEAASLLLGLESIGVCLSYGIISSSLPVYMLVTVLALLVIGYLFFLIASCMANSEARYCGRRHKCRRHDRQATQMSPT